MYVLLELGIEFMLTLRSASGGGLQVPIREGAGVGSELGGCSIYSREPQSPYPFEHRLNPFGAKCMRLRHA